jgi:Protein of unknown function (Hypoth_ymh)
MGMGSSIPSSNYLEKSFGDDYTSILADLRGNTNDKFDGFDLPPDCYRDFGGSLEITRDVLNSKIHQLTRYLELVHFASSKTVEIGSVYNLIQDQELKSRCSDLLSAPNHFDRVINQATQVLEERIRLCCPDLKTDFGATLIGKAVNPEPSKSRIVFSDTASEQEGYAALTKGLILAFRNPSHHRFLELVSREQALQICAFIDNVLAALKLADIKDKS